MNKIFWRKIHRWMGLILAGFAIFYCITGLLLNHRQDFRYFQTKQRSVMPIEIQNKDLLQGFINTYKKQINRSDDPKVIRIKDGGIIEFLYGSHGKTTYVIDPQTATMTKIEKSEQQPWHWLNRLHKAYKTSIVWLFLTDFISLLIIALTISGLIIFRYTRLDFLLLAGGMLWLALGMLVA